ncbi:ABC transporter permease [candidate division KSB3 bacterium]|uniref:ABC transporter permease n=1 Tax=candidate division KSB3 bacterium TaxID=2044937 RepID=A0A2G6KB56_9BACT|nr:MAG: ABC transporter permease [candidate division KSB3 bacterium]
MEYLFQAILEAFHLLIAFDREILFISLTSLKVSTIAILLASVTGVPLGFLIGISSFSGRGIIITLLNTLMALPTVVIGLLGYAMISRQGPLGDLQLLFTPTAMILGQFILATPIIMALTISATQGIDPRVRRTATALGANGFQSALTMLREARFALMAAIIAGFGRVIGEVGASMMLGGNIKGVTRNLSTAIAMETSKGEFGFGLALGLILMAIALSVNFFLRFFQRKR